MTARSTLRRRRAPVGWWGRLPLGVARLLLAGLTVLSVVAGMATSAWLVRPDGGSGAAGAPAGRETDRSGAVELGPLSIALPAELGPWTPVSSEAFDPVRSGSGAAGFAVEGAWGALAPGGLVVTVMTVTQGSHQGVEGLSGPFEGSAALDVPWPGPGAHVAGSQETGGVRELLLAVELGDGGLAVLSLSGPTEAFADGRLDESFATVGPVD